MNIEALERQPTLSTPPKRTDEQREYFRWRLVSILIPGTFLLWTALGNWYERNPYHKYKEWDILILKENNIFWYWIRPVLMVQKYALKDWIWKYEVMSISDDGGDFMEWMKDGKIQEWVCREVIDQETHFKWNIENQFVKVNAKTAEEALALYGKR